MPRRTDTASFVIDVKPETKRALVEIAKRLRMSQSKTFEALLYLRCCEARLLSETEAIITLRGIGIHVGLVELRERAFP